MKNVTSSKRKMNNINKEGEKFYVFTTESYTKDEFTELKTSDFLTYVRLFPLTPSFLLQLFVAMKLTMQAVFYSMA